jgi:SAM-dependent methyltransferase
MICRICDQSDLVLYYTQGWNDQFRFFLCRNCRLVNLDLENIQILEHQKKYADHFRDPLDRRLNRGSVQSYRFIKKYIAERGSYLDIGCGNGSLLHLARQDGWTVKGLELSEFMAENVRRVLSIDVEVANFLEYEKFEEQYDLVSLRHVLEHLPDSRLAMKKINRLLKTGGYAEFEFPNINGLSMKIGRSLANSGLYRKKYSREYLPGHCNEFSLASFKYLVSISGFRLIRWESYSYNRFKNIFYHPLNLGSKARALIRKVSDI